MEYKSAVLSYKAFRQEQQPYGMPILIVAAVHAVAQSTFAFGRTAAHSETQKLYVATVVSPSPPLVFGTICLYLLEHCQQLRQF